MNEFPNDNLLTEEFSNILGIKLNLFQSASSGGRKWNINEAVRFSGKVAGKVEAARADLNNVIGQDATQVKEKRTADFKRMVADAKLKLPLLEKKYKEFLEAKKKGWSSQANRDAGKQAYDRILSIEEASHQAWKLKHDWITENLIDKTAQGLKTVNLAPIRGVLLLFLKFNVFNSATMFKLASIRTPEKFKVNRLKYKQFGGNRTKFDEAIEKGYKKKPILGKQMKINWNKISSADGDISTPLVIPNAVISSLPVLGTGVGAAIGAASLPVPPATAAPTAAVGSMGGVVGSILAGMFAAINEMQVPMSEDETQPEITDGTLDSRTAKSMANENELDNGGFPTWGYFAIGGTVLLIGGLLTWYYLKSKKK